MERPPIRNVDELMRHRIEDESTRFEEYRRTFELTPEDLRKPLLDVGAGSGEFISHVRREYGNTKAFGVELDEEQVRTSSVPEAMVVADGRKLPFADGAFELVIAKEYLPMFYEKGAVEALNELLRVVSSGGRVLVHVVKPETELEELRESGRGGRREALVKRRIAGAEKLFDEFERLQMNGYRVVHEQHPGLRVTTIVVITKPSI